MSEIIGNAVATSRLNPSPLQILQDVFGYSAFRGPQQAIIDEIVAGRDALVLMPTGGGKSLCYQIPALVRPGVGVVISPLIALMQDQVDALVQLGVKAGYLNSTQDTNSALAVERALNAGELDLLYIAPERLTQGRMLAILEHTRIALFAIDEAHCVSQWGHDFRADYLQLSLLHERFPHVPRIALTATADVRTREEIARRLDLENAQHFISGFDRPNIQYRITQKQSPRQQLLHFLRNEHSGDAGIVYCLSRKKVDTVSAWLSAEGFKALPYHAGLSADQRQRHQRRFLREDSIIMVATIAFGMGIDKPDVRFIAHLDMPRSLESYYQETGRAGRDGQVATAWMVYGLQDVITQRQMLESSQGNDEFKRIERQRLEAMLALCEVTSCRRQVLLRYFGDTLEMPCGNCDTCLTPVETWDARVPVQMALSCVYRTGQRFGVNHLIDVLRGSDNERIRQLGHHHVSTYGIGTELSANQWRSIFRQLVAGGYIHVDLDGYGALKLTDACRPLLRGEQPVSLRKDDPKPARSKDKARARRGEPTIHVDTAAWEALRSCRKRLAEEQGVPPYVIFHDATLRDMLDRNPRSLDEFAGISGVGQRKLALYGEAFLSVLESLDS